MNQQKNQQSNQQKNQTKQNYQKILDRTIEELQQLQRVPTLLLHSCCAPCSSYVLEYLSEYFQITVLYYNPNIYPDEEYKKRVAEQNVPEGGERCFSCYEMRLREAAEYAKRLGMDYFTTTLSISPLKNAAKLNEIGLKLEEEYDVHYLLSDFKKKNGYQRSVELSHEYGMYRQDYCGCVFSMRERERVRKEQTER